VERKSANAYRQRSATNRAREWLRDGALQCRSASAQQTTTRAAATRYASAMSAIEIGERWRHRMKVRWIAAHSVVITAIRCAHPSPCHDTSRTAFRRPPGGVQTQNHGRQQAFMRPAIVLYLQRAQLPLARSAVRLRAFCVKEGRKVGRGCADRSGMPPPLSRTIWCGHVHAIGT